MTFPQTILPIEVAFQFDGATWTNVTSDVRGEQQIRITRGRSDWGQQVDYGRCSFSLSNTDGAYSTRNPESPYYGQIGRNTPVRVSVNTGSVAAWLPGTSTGLDTLSTPDVAALDITGDIDVRLDATLLNWYLADTAQGSGSTSVLTELIGKFATTTNQRSWVMYTQNGYLKFSWSEDGGSVNGYTTSSTKKLPVPASGRLAVRVTLDVNNGAGGYTVRFYTADTINGTWTQLGNDVVYAATTSIFASTATLHIGNAISGVAYNTLLGHVHAAEVRNGIGGTAVANPDFTAQASGTTSFADAAGRTWTANNNAEITNRKTRFVGEVASWTPERNQAGNDVICKVEAAGIMRRLGQGAIAAKSPMYREFTSPTRLNIVGYWPMEDAAGASGLASALDGHPAVRLTGSVTPAAYADWPASDALPTLTSGSMRATVPSYTATNYVFLRWFTAVPAAGVVSTQRLLSITTTGTAKTWSVYVNTAGSLEVRAYDSDGTQILASGFTTFAVNGKQKSIGLELTQDGADVDYKIFVYDVADSTLTTSSSGVVTGTLAAYTAGRCTEVRFGEDGAMNGTAIGHLAVSDDVNGFASTVGPLLGWDGETAAARVHRLGVEEAFNSYATAPGDEQMGVQARATVLELMRAAGEVDEGILAELRDVLGIRLVQRASMYNQTVALTMDYTSSDGLVAPLDPADDDQAVTNDVTVVRDGGSSARTTLPEGDLSTQAPPNGIGLYDTSYTLGLYNDMQPPMHAGWRLHLGTWNETRFPQVTVNLANAPQQIDDAAGVDTGSRIQITSPPAWLAADTIDLRVEGYSEVLDQYTWTLTYNCTPYGPFNVAYVADATYGRADTDGSETTTAISSSATSVTVLTTGETRWVWSAGFASEFPFDVRAGGEVWSVTAIASSFSDALGRTASNGWGTADSGQFYSTAGGTSADFSVGAGYGVHVLSAANSSRRTFIDYTVADFDYYGSVTVSATATGASLYGALAGRYTDSSNVYLARVEFTTSGTLVLSVRKRVAGVETELGTFTPGISYAAGTFYRVRFQGTGTRLRAKVWAAAGTEPGLWQVIVSDSSLTTGLFLGCYSISAVGNTNGSSVQVRYDNLDLVNPQKFTITRSVNGVTKAHDAGTDVRLAYPAPAAL